MGGMINKRSTLSLVRCDSCIKARQRLRGRGAAVRTGQVRPNANISANLVDSGQNWSKPGPNGA